MWRVNVNNVQNVSLSIALIASFAFSQNGIEAKEVYGEYCFTKDIEDSKEVWNLEQYKRNSQFLFTYIPCSYKGNYSLTLNNSGVLFGVPLYSSRYKENEPSKCDKKEAMERDSVIANKFIIEATHDDAKKIADMSNKFHSIDWNINYDSSYVRKNISGTVEIFISGFCTKDQLKAIKKRKKKK